MPIQLKKTVKNNPISYYPYYYSILYEHSYMFNLIMILHYITYICMYPDADSAKEHREEQAIIEHLDDIDFAVSPTRQSANPQDSKMKSSGYLIEIDFVESNAVLGAKPYNPVIDVDAWIQVLILSICILYQNCTN